jgi:outer membrane protein assembly factor BamB
MRCLAVLVLALIPTAGFASDWPKYCANLEMTGVAPSGGNITVASARNLVRRWSVALDGPIASAPTVYNGKVYIGDWSGIEWAIDVETGAPLARTDLGTTYAPQCSPSSLGITSSAAVDGDTVFVAGGLDYFYALDRDTLAVRWKERLGDASAGYYGWCSPAVAGGYVYQGVSSNCDSPFITGRLVLFDRVNGSELAERSLVPPMWPHNFIGAGVWTSPAIDIPNRTVFVTTGSALDIDDGYSFSIVRLALDDLRVYDSWKINTRDWGDSDWGTSPTLFTSADGRQLVGAGQKDGHYYAFARDDLASGPVWSTEIAQPGNCPQCGHGILSTAAFDGHRLYVGGGQPSGDTLHQGSITALDPTDGRILWQTVFERPVIAPISYTNGVLFTTTGPTAVALSAATGDILFAYTTEADCYGGVAITDKGIFFGDLAGNLYRLSAIDPPPRKRSVAR